MIVDSHQHIFPPMGGAAGHSSRREHMRFIQREIATHHLPVRRASDGAVADFGQSLLDRRGHAVKNLTDVAFRGGEFGRLMWSHGGEDYYKQYLPPHMRDLSAPADQMVAQMDHAGIEKAVLHNGHTYGRLNRFLSDAVRKYPDRLWGMALVDEWRRTRRASEMRWTSRWTRWDCTAFGSIRGTFISKAAGTGLTTRRTRHSSTTYGSGGRLSFGTVPPSKASYMATLRALGRWLQSYPEVPCVLTNGFPFDYFGSQRRVRFPEEFWDVLSAPNLLVEICFPIIMGGRLDYPYPELWPIIRQFYRRLGPEKLVWGSDMPNVERFCTYRQCLEYMRFYCDSIPAPEMDLICGDNLVRMFEG